MNNIDRLQEYKCLYNHEIEYSYQKNNRMVVYLTLLTLLGTGDIYLFKGLFPISVVWWWFGYLTLVIITSACFFYSIKAFYDAFIEHSYSYVDMSAIDKSCTQFRKQLEEQNVSSEEIDKAIDQTLYSMLLEMYLNCALQNQIVNIAKQQSHKKFIETYIKSIIFLMISFIYNVVFNGLIGGI